MNKKEVLKKYFYKPAMKLNYGYGGYLYPDEIADFEMFTFFLHDMNSTEIALSRDGFNFIKEYHGLDKVLNYIVKHEDFNIKNKKSALEWLKDDIDNF